MPVDIECERDIKMVAEEIKQYLNSRGNATDTAEGIAKWWIMRQRLYEETKKVHRALDYLDRAGDIAKRKLADGSIIYTVIDANQVKGKQT